MAFNWGVGDILALAKLSWDLYHGCYLVARGAPDDYRQMVNELASFQGVLRTLRDDTSSDNGYLQRLDENRKEMLGRCLQSSHDTLKGLEKLTVKYRQLGVSEGPQFWTKIKWTTKQREISQLKNKVMVCSCNLNLCMSSIGNSSLARLEASMTKALRRQDASEMNRQLEEAKVEDDRDEIVPLRKASTDSAILTSSPSSEPLRRQTTEATLVEPQQYAAQPSPPIDADDLGFGSTVAGKGAPAPGHMRKGSGLHSPVDHAPGDLPLPSPLILSDERKSTEFPRKMSGQPFPQRERELSTSSKASFDPNAKGPNNVYPDLQAVMTEALNELKRAREKEKSARPLRIVRRHDQHLPDEDLKGRFKQLADDELKIRRLNTRDWLRVATWWLIKARFSTRIEEDSPQINSGASFSVSSDGSSAINQAYVDLLKASWVLYDLILTDESHVASLLTDENRKLCHTLMDGLSDDLADFQPLEAPGKEVLVKQNYNIWELLQPAEEAYEDEGTFPGLENERWITVEMEDAGADDETVLYRTFVDASIGHRKVRMKSKGAPYMLLLSIREGESEPKVTLCNQSGTLSLTRDLTIDDLQAKPAIVGGLTGMNAGPQEALPLNFDRTSVTLMFNNQKDFQNFMFLPRAYFEAVKRREPRHLERSTETLIFSRSVELFERLKASTMKPMNPRHISRSCDLRVLETTSRYGWETTRRLVISSSAGENPPWCMDVFLPLSRVQIRREGNTPTILVKWSDCSQKKVKSSGDYNSIYSYVYDDSNPNNALSLVFRTVQDANDFESVVLHLTLNSLFSWTSSQTSGSTYIISDGDPEPKTYKAISQTFMRFDWRYSELYYVYRDTDFLYDSTDRSAIRIHFPLVSYTDYISTHVDRMYQPEKGDQIPRFKCCGKKFGNTNVDFYDESTAMQFMSSISAKHVLLFSRRCQYLTTKPPSRFGGTKSNKGSVEVQLWLKGNTIRLLGRWEDKVEDKWVTMSLPRDGMDNKKNDNRVSFAKLSYERGRKVDMANLIARDPRDKKEEGKKIGPLTIALESVRDREDFVLSLESRIPPAPMSPDQERNLIDF